MASRNKEKVKKRYNIGGSQNNIIGIEQSNPQVGFYERNTCGGTREPKTQIDESTRKETKAWGGNSFERWNEMGPFGGGVWFWA